MVRIQPSQKIGRGVLRPFSFSVNSHAMKEKEQKNYSLHSISFLRIVKFINYLTIILGFGRRPLSGFKGQTEQQRLRFPRFGTSVLWVKVMERDNLCRREPPRAVRKMNRVGERASTVGVGKGTICRAGAFTGRAGRGFSPTG
jgi:hypothetical protein